MTGRLLHMTNATKATILATVNAALGLALVFGAPLTDNQVGAILALANAVLGGAVAATYQLSSKRAKDPLPRKE